LAAQPGVGSQSGNCRGGGLDIDGDALAGVADVAVVAVDLEEMPEREEVSVARRRHPRRHHEAVDPVTDGVAVTVPVGGDDGQARGHRLDRRQTEGLLDVVAERREDVRGRPHEAADVGLAAVEADQIDRGTQLRRAVDEGLFDHLVGEPSSEEEMELLGRTPGGFFETEVERKRVGLGVKAQSADEQHRHVVLGDAVPSAGLGAGRVAFGGCGEPVAVDPEGNDRRLQNRLRSGADALRQVGAPVVVHLPDRLLDALRRTDHRVPGLGRRQQQGADAVHDTRRGGGVGDAAEAEKTLVEVAPRPGHIGDVRPWMHQASGLVEAGYGATGDPSDRLGTGERRDLTQEVGEMLGSVGTAVEVVGLNVASERLQESLTGGLAAHQLGPRRVKAVGVIMDRRVRSGHRCHSHSWSGRSSSW
jgi:hypothetical protein